MAKPTVRDVEGDAPAAKAVLGFNSLIVWMKPARSTRYAAEIAYIPRWGGRYNNAKDRDVVTFAVSARF